MIEIRLGRTGIDLLSEIEAALAADACPCWSN